MNDFSEDFLLNRDNYRNNSDDEYGKKDEIEEEELVMVEKLEFEFDKSKGIKQVIIEDYCFILTQKQSILMYDAELKLEKEFSFKFKNNSIYKIYVDPNGSHIITTTQDGDNYYVNMGWKNKNPVMISKLKNMIIESIGWDKSNKQGETTKAILIGTRNSCIYQAIFDSTKPSNPLKSFKLLFDLNKRLDILKSTGPILGLQMESFNNSDDRLVMATTSFRIFQFTGGPTLEDIFEEYTENGVLKYNELPYVSKSNKATHNELRFLKKKSQPASSFCWLTLPGIFHGNLSYKEADVGTDAISESEVIQFDTNKSSTNTSVISMEITEFHILLLYPDKLQVLVQPVGLCNNKAVKRKNKKLPLSQVVLSSINVKFEKHIRNALGLTKDSETGAIYLYTTAHIYRIYIEDETKGIWKIYLEKAIDPDSSKEKHFETAISLSNDNSDIKNVIESAKADYYFSQERYNEAAVVYARTTKSFEEVCVKFYQKGEQDSLRIFLSQKLTRIISRRKDDKEDATQVLCLGTWLTEIYLESINKLELTLKEIESGSDNLSIANNDIKQKSSLLVTMTTMTKKEKIKNIKIELEKMTIKFHNFLDECKDFLNIETTYRLISSHGQMKEFNYYAMLIKEYGTVISQLITDKKYRDALEILYKQCVEPKFEDNFYKYAPVLMQNLPEITVSCLKRKKFLDPGKLIPAMMRYLSDFHKRDDKNEKNHVITYLEWCIQQGNENPAIHNLLLSLYAQEGDEGKLLLFLNFEGDNKTFYDEKYALRICTKHYKIESCVKLYSSMELYEDAVGIALQHNKINLAKECAEKPEENEKKKKLWLKIAKHVIEKKNVKKAIEFLKETDKIKLEDVLPLFPDFVLIDDFKDEVCKSLKEYKADIESLKQDMSDATQNATLINDDIKDLKHRYGYLTKNSKCNGENCYLNIFAREFYLFPCQHMFHITCLVDEIKKYGHKTKVQRIEKYLKEKESMQNDKKQEEKYLEVSKKLDDLCSSECPSCGSLMINSIDASFTTQNEIEKSSWNI